MAASLPRITAMSNLMTERMKVQNMALCFCNSINLSHFHMHLSEDPKYFSTFFFSFLNLIL